MDILDIGHRLSSGSLAPATNQQHHLLQQQNQQEGRTSPLAASSAAFADALVALCRAHEQEVESLREELSLARSTSPHVRGDIPVAKEVQAGAPQDPGQDSSMLSLEEIEGEESTEIATVWLRLAIKLRSGYRKNAARAFVLLPHWVLLTGGTDASRSLRYAQSADVRNFETAMVTGKTLHFVEEDPASVCFSCIPVLHPSSIWRMIWAFVGLMFLIWDTFTIPLQVFELGSLYDFMRSAGFVIFAYWSLDIALQFNTGFWNGDGILEMRRSVIGRQYCLGWLWVDLAVLFMDIFIMVVIDGLDSEEPTAASGGVGVARGVRLTRLARLLRLVRLLRVRRLQQMLVSLMDRLGSQHLLLALNFTKYAAIIFTMNHYVACGWYAVASFNYEDEMTWLLKQGADRPGQYHYILSLHWSLTQFAPSTNDIAPTNGRERVFASITTLVAMLVFSSFVSSVTNAVNQLRVVNLEPIMEQARMRDYMLSKNVSKELFGRIQRSFKRSLKQRQNKVQEQDVSFFSHMPESLRIEMHIEIYMPRLWTYAVFDFFAHTDINFFKRLCHLAVEETFYNIGQDVFIDGTESTGIRYATSGRLYYETIQTLSHAMSLDLENLDQSLMAPSSSAAKMAYKSMPVETWFSEMSLWVAWFHTGRLVIAHAAEIIQVNTKRVADTIKGHAHPILVQGLRALAILTVSHAEELENSHPITDMPMSEGDMQLLCDRALKFANMRFGKDAGGLKGDRSEGSQRQSIGIFGGLVRPQIPGVTASMKNRALKSMFWANHAGSEVDRMISDESPELDTGPDTDSFVLRRACKSSVSSSRSAAGPNNHTSNSPNDDDDNDEHDDHHTHLNTHNSKSSSSSSSSNNNNKNNSPLVVETKAQDKSGAMATASLEADAAEEKFVPATITDEMFSANAVNAV